MDLLSIVKETKVSNIKMITFSPRLSIYPKIRYNITEDIELSFLASVSVYETVLRLKEKSQTGEKMYSKERFIQLEIDDIDNQEMFINGQKVDVPSNFTDKLRELGFATFANSLSLNANWQELIPIVYKAVRKEKIFKHHFPNLRFLQDVLEEEKELYA